jgi:hypothetical protein
MFFERGKTGFYTIPGNIIVDICYSHTSLGVVFKNITKPTVFMKKELEPEPNKSYLLGFDRGKNVFTFTEYQPQTEKIR